MSDFIWIDETLVDAIHEMQLAEHGGLPGIRGRDLLESALARPRNLVAHRKRDAARCAAAYGHGIARKRPWREGNERVALVAVELFLELNGRMLVADDADCVLTMLGIAAGDMTENEFAEWIRERVSPVA